MRPLPSHALSSGTGAAGASASTAAPLRIALVNNMPDAALEATERQFGSLLSEAAVMRPMELWKTWVPEVPRSAAALTYLRDSYRPLGSVLAARPDALIVTGMEPGPGALMDEPYWPRFAQLVDWAKANALSSIWSCLAAHAAVQHLHHIARCRLPRKRFGVYAHSIEAAHPLLAGVEAPLRMPHSRWNELPVDALRRAGYEILSFSPQTGADLFVDQGRGAFVCFQGHPEYDNSALLKEFRRDVGRYLRGEQPHYPALPAGYFSAAVRERLSAFEGQARERRDPGLMAHFPVIEVGDESAWKAAAVMIYRNWLASLEAARRSLGVAPCGAGA